MLTFKELDALMKRHNEAIRRQFYCASLVAVMVHNMAINPKKTKPLKMDYFVPKRRRRQSSTVQMEVARAIAKMLDGKVV